ncbi:small ribosomal subunit protein mS23 isoform X2 [Amia ocellicauda]|uniref:small ribosomal subunit protein mS23 isoform X2 n=1 Tax=Amia ocellicauda TaxID=2972642 RepID=UPI003463B3BD
MAGSRLEKFGTVFTRVRDLMRSGVVKQANKPLWYDVYAAFPPKREPLYEKPTQRFGKVVDPVPDIFYSEDSIRAKFFEVFGNGPKAFDLAKSSSVSSSQWFVEKYRELERQGELDEEALFEETAKHLLSEGIMLRRRVGYTAHSAMPESRDPVLEMKLKDMLAELQQEANPGDKQMETPQG